jgi:hypothetical protein
MSVALPPERAIEPPNDYESASHVPDDDDRDPDDEGDEADDDPEGDDAPC